MVWVIVGGGVVLCAWVILIVVEAIVGYRVLWASSRAELDERCLAVTRLLERWHNSSRIWPEWKLEPGEQPFGTRVREWVDRHVAWLHFRRPRQLELGLTPSSRWEAIHQHKADTKLSPAKRRRLRKL